MASWTDQPTQFRPYVQQLPVEAMLAVGVEKQRRYDEGIRKIQSAIDRVVGLDLMKDEDKNLLKSKLSELDTNLRTVAAGDFSNYQLVNTIGRNIGRISSDEGIQTAVNSTALARREMARMDKDREEGKLDPSNEYNFNKKLDAWLNDGKAGTSFKGTYIPHFDIWKFAKDTFDAVQPDGMTFDQIYQLDANGNPAKDEEGNLIYSPTMVRMEKEGRSPEKVKQTIQQIFSDPRVAQQLSISGQYTYRDIDSTQLKDIIIKQRDATLAGYDSEINELNIKKNLGNDVQKDIDSLEASKKTVSDSYDKYISGVDKNPDGIKGKLYTDDVSSRYATMFGQIKTKQQVLENPAWRAMFDQQKEANAQSRWAQTFAWDKKMDLAEYEQRERLALLKSKEEGTGLKDLSDYTPSNEPSDPKRVVMEQSANYEDAVKEYGIASDKFIWEMVLSGNDKYNSQFNELTSKQNLTREQAISKIINDAATATGKTVDEFKAEWEGKATIEFDKLPYKERIKNPILSDAYSNYRMAKMNFQSESTINDKVTEEFRKRIGDVAKEIDLSKIKPQTITYNGRSYSLTPQNIYDLAVYKNGTKINSRHITNRKMADTLEREAKMAYNRLREAGLSSIVEAFDGTRSRIREVKDKNGKVTSLLDYTGTMEGISYDESYIKGPTASWLQVYQISQVFNDKVFEEALEDKANIIQEYYGTNPNLTTKVLTGKLETDRSIINDISTYMASFETVGNLSHDFKKFRSDLNIDEPQKNALTTNVIKDASGNPMVEIVLNKEGRRVGGMTITPDQARQLGVDPNMIYETKETRGVRNTIKARGGKTSYGNPKDESTYIGGDYYYDRNQFPLIVRDSNYDVKVNIVESNGVYYPYVYMNNGTDFTIESLQGSPVLQNVIATLKSAITPALIEKYISESKE